jgi:hypothetical protein
MPTRAKSLVLMHVPDDSGRRVRLTSLEYQRRGRSKYQTLRGVVDGIPGALFEITSTYDSSTESVTIVVQQDGVMACNVAVAMRSATYVGVRLPSGQFIEIYHDWPKVT